MATTRNKEESLEAAIEKSEETDKSKFTTDNKTYDPTKPYEIDGAAGRIGVTRGHLNMQRLAGRAVAAALQGLSVDQRTYEMHWISVMLSYVTQSPGYLPAECDGKIDNFIDSLYEFEDLQHYYREWETWRNSFRTKTN